MARDVFQTANDCRPCAEARGTRYKTQKPMKLFPAGKPLEFVAMDLLGPFPAAESGNQHILVITDRFSKLAQVTPLVSTTAPAVANAFVENWVIPYGIPKFVLSDNGPQFVAKFFEAICVLLGLKHLTTTAYHPQSNGQTERYNQTLATRLRIFTNQHEKNWDRLIQPLTYAYNAQVHRTTGETPFSLVLTRPPNDIILENEIVMPSTEPLTPQEARLQVMERSTELVQRAAVRTEQKQAKYKAFHDKKVRTKLRLQPGDEVFLDNPPSVGQTPAERLADEPAGKLHKKTLAAFKVIKVTDQTTTIVKDEIEETVSIDRLTLAPPPLDPVTLKPVITGTPSADSPASDDLKPHPPEQAKSSSQEGEGAIHPPEASKPHPPEQEESSSQEGESPSDGSPPSADLKSRPDEDPTTQHADQPDQYNYEDQEDEDARDEAAKSADDDNDNAKPDPKAKEYVVDHLVACRQTPKGPYYKIRWYGYKPKYDTWEPSHHIPANFRKRFHQQEAKKAERRSRRGRRQSRNGEGK